MTIKLEVGKSYRTRGGWRAEVIPRENDLHLKLLWVFHHEMPGYDHFCFRGYHRPDGAVAPLKWWSMGKESSYDIVAEWEEQGGENDSFKEKI